MEAGEASIQKVLEGSKQFVVPHFQRPYAWREREWSTLFNDVVERADDADTTPHFIGPIVSAPGRSIPEGVEKRTLIDGQQRLTSIVILLTAIRDAARHSDEPKVADKIQYLITNPYDDGLDRYKLLPTQGETVEDSDRAALIALVDGIDAPSSSGIRAARLYFDKRIRRMEAISLEQLSTALTRRVTLISIVLGEKDNPYRIFESLNGKGRPLNQGDLLRNFFFMRIDQAKHEQVYASVWRPMQRRVGEELLTEFVRHDLIASTGTLVREADVYASVKARVEEVGDALGQLRGLAERAGHYEVLLKPELAPTPSLRVALAQIRRLDVTVSYPLLLSAYGAFAQHRIDERALLGLLNIVESYVVRRFVCGIPSNGMTKAFSSLATQCAPFDEGFVARVALALSSRDCPRDDKFRDRIQTTELYGAGERREKTKLILERLEMASGHKEFIDASTLTIEHVMPQSLTSEWTRMLGADAEETHDELVHTLGNLTLTGYNAELSNLPFATKRARYEASHIELNKWFGSIDVWNREAIESRATALAERAMQIWPWFGPEEVTEGASKGDEVTGTVPTSLVIRGEVFATRSWVEVLRAVANYVAEMGEAKFDEVAAELPKYFGRDATTFRRTSKLAKLSNGAYIETNLSSLSVMRVARAALTCVGVAPEEWEVSREADLTDEKIASKAQRLEFWTGLRDSLSRTGAFAQLNNPTGNGFYAIRLGRAGVSLRLSANVTEHRVSVKVLVEENIADAFFTSLNGEREAIARELGCTLEWDLNPKNVVRMVGVTMAVAPLNARENWPAAIEELATLATKMHAAFAPRVAALPR